jgi:hypothetical protein
VRLPLRPDEWELIAHLAETLHMTPGAVIVGMWRTAYHLLRTVPADRAIALIRNGTEPESSS